ncbi:MAG: phosphatidylinositol-specific phospholipase C/glycerophosphodiester phosphodiesterase family protein [Cyclobacteriaceae bacterium]
MLVTTVKKWILLLMITFPFAGMAQVTPLPHAHAHNDYWHERPLLDALDHGFTSVEADVLLIDDELYVGHDMPEGNHQLPTLREAYLEPLRKRINQHGGAVYPGYDDPIYLMIDIKTDAQDTYNRLKVVLQPYQAILSRSVSGTYQPGAVTIFLSGNRPIEQVQQDLAPLVGIDGRPEDLEQGYSATFMPVISQHFQGVLDWDGTQPISRKQRRTLERLTQQAHQEGKKVRLWATPENPLVWKTLLEGGVDFLNTDQLADLQQFLEQQSE